MKNTALRHISNKKFKKTKIKTFEEFCLDGLDEPMKRPLFLVMQKIWFDKIESGEKTEEYRYGTPFYKSRLCKVDKKTGAILSLKNFKTVILQEGYTKDARRMIVEVKGVTLKRDFTIHLGEIIERINFNKL